MIEFYKGRRVLITGHTGFKGVWLGEFLQVLGADTLGISLPPELGSLAERGAGLPPSNSLHLDIRDSQKLKSAVETFNPETIFHLAAQPLVRRSYKYPVETFETNVMGTVNLLQASAPLSELKEVVVVTTDKVYKNVEKSEGYLEEDALDGKDPYSASKVGTEMVVRAWRTLSELNNGPKLYSVRAGNVIGGGDHAEDRLIPDLIRGFRAGKSVGIRNPSSLRPWQHVLEPLYGYLLLASKSQNLNLQPSYNFGPNEVSKLSVAEISDFSAKYWGANARWHEELESESVPESKLLWLESKLATRDLGWLSQLSAYDALKLTIDWEKQVSAKEPKFLISDQINRYMEKL
jgi:CDP-glucose 4,6-dehydratase